MDPLLLGLALSPVTSWRVSSLPLTPVKARQEPVKTRHGIGKSEQRTSGK